MRGLQARVQLAHHRVQLAMGADENIAVDFLLEAMETARADGSRDALAGNSEPPVMFNDEPVLLHAWTEGQETIQSLREMSECAGCSSTYGEPCPHHG